MHDPRNDKMNWQDRTFNLICELKRGGKDRGWETTVDPAPRPKPGETQKPDVRARTLDPEHLIRSRALSYLRGRKGQKGFPADAAVKSAEVDVKSLVSRLQKGKMRTVKGKRTLTPYGTKATTSTTGRGLGHGIKDIGGGHAPIKKTPHHKGPNLKKTSESVWDERVFDLLVEGKRWDKVKKGLKNVRDYAKTPAGIANALISTMAGGAIRLGLNQAGVTEPGEHLGAKAYKELKGKPPVTAPVEVKKEKESKKKKLQKK